MSTPVKACTVAKAVNDKELRQRMHTGMHANLNGGGFTIIGCQCKPHCMTTVDVDELEDLMLWWKIRKPKVTQ